MNFDYVRLSYTMLVPIHDSTGSFHSET